MHDAGAPRRRRRPRTWQQCLWRDAGKEVSEGATSTLPKPCMRHGAVLLPGGGQRGRPRAELALARPMARRWSARGRAVHAAVREQEPRAASRESMLDLNNLTPLFLDVLHTHPHLHYVFILGNHTLFFFCSLTSWFSHTKISRTQTRTAFFLNYNFSLH